jgi:hypothetical protein
MSPEFVRSAELIARVMPPDGGWWIIGSAALALSRLDVAPRDIDVFAAPPIMEAARRALGVAAAPSDSTLFRSRPYFQFHPRGGLEVDFMGGLEVRAGSGWTRLQIESRLPVIVGNVSLFVPSLDEQAVILRLFGRPKDLARAALIKA